MQQKFAIIDLGSNSVRLVVYAQDESGAIYELDNIKSVIRLSSHINDKGEITKDGIKKTIKCLRRYKQFCNRRQITEIIGIATAAIRSAANQQYVLDLIQEETGLPFRVLNGEEEAYYGFLAAVNSVPVDEAITVDMGGGSTEVTYFKDRKIIHSHSFPFGVVTLTQQFMNTQRPTFDRLIELKKFIVEQFSSQSWILSKGCPIIAMGGTARNLARVHQRKRQYSMSSLHHYIMDTDEVGYVFDWLKQLPIEQRKEVQGLSKDRADIIVAGMGVFLHLMELTGSGHLIISNKGLRDGVLFEKSTRQGNQPVLQNVLRYSTEQFMKRYKADWSHCTHVAKLSVQLFDELKKESVHSYGERERALLEAGALLHDIGRSINIIESSRHTFYLLQNVLLTGATHKERLLIGLIASYKNNRQLREFSAAHQDILSKQDEHFVHKLGVLVLVARVLDRSMSQQVRSLELITLKKKIQLKLYLKEDKLWELDLLEEHLQKLTKAFDIPFTISTMKPVGESEHGKI